MEPLSQRGLAPRPGIRSVEAGDIAPGFRLPDQSGRQVDLRENDVAGKPTLVVFSGSPGGLENLAAFGQINAEVIELGGQIIAISRTRVDDNAELCRHKGIEFPVLANPEGTVFGHYGLDGQDGQADLVSFMLDANQHVLSVLREPAGRQVDMALEAVRAEAGKRLPRLMEAHPPVLVMPGVFSPEDCRRLIAIYNMDGNVWVEPGHGDKGMTSDYKMRVPEYGRKDRVDHWVVNPETRDFISARLQARLFPEIRKAFQYKITKAETYRIGCYEGERCGDHQGHRDNTAPLVAHRRFAVSVNLNAEEFEGGELRFPEFGGQRYRPPTGAAIAFSCSLYHEALEVTRGRRYVLMAFLFGDH